MKLNVPADLADQLRGYANDGESLDEAACRILRVALKHTRKRTTFDIIRDNLAKIPVGMEFTVLQVMPLQLTGNSVERQRFGQSLGNAVTRKLLPASYLRYTRTDCKKYLRVYRKTE